MTLDRWLNSLAGLFIFLVTGLCEGGRRLVLFVVDVELPGPDPRARILPPARDWLTAFLARCRSNADPLPPPIAT